MEPSPLTALFAVMLLVVFYRRYRRSFGRQRLRPAGLVFVIGLMSSIGLIMLLVPRTPIGFKLAGVPVGVALGLLALRLTRFESGPGGPFYVPNPYIGLVVLGLFVGRMVYRLLGVSHFLATVHASGPGAPAIAPPIASSPLTMFLLFVLLGYYVAYYGAVLLVGLRMGSGSSGS